MTLVFTLFLLTLQVVMGVAIVHARNLFSAVMLASIYSLLLASNFFVLDAVDVALTEAAVGAGVATVLLLSALAMLPPQERAGPPSSQLVPLLVVVFNVALLVYASLDKPRLHDPQAPVHSNLSAWFMETTASEIDIPNVVTAVLGSFRAYDTLGEVFVVFCAAIGVLFVLGLPTGEKARASDRARGLKHHLLLKVIARLLVPFIMLFGLYVQFHGEYSPGGGFQAGVIIAAAVILYALIDGQQAALRVFPTRFLLYLMAAGALLFTVTGLLPLLQGYTMLDYDFLSPDSVTAQQIGILIIELGVGMAVTGAMLLMFHAFASRGREAE